MGAGCGVGKSVLPLAASGIRLMCAIRHRNGCYTFNQQCSLAASGHGLGLGKPAWFLETPWGQLMQYQYGATIAAGGHRLGVSKRAPFLAATLFLVLWADLYDVIRSAMQHMSCVAMKKANAVYRRCLRFPLVGERVVLYSRPFV